MAQNLAGLAATRLRAEPLVMLIARIADEPFFAVATFFPGTRGLHPAFSTADFRRDTQMRFLEF